MQPVLRNMLLDERNEVKPFSEEALYNALVGTITSTVVNAATGEYSRGTGMADPPLKYSQGKQPGRVVVDDAAMPGYNGSKIGAGQIEDAPIKPYVTSRPKYGRTQVDDVWNAHVNPETDTVIDPSGATIVWDRTKPRNGQWDMGHIPGQKYSNIHEKYMNGEIGLNEFLKWYRNPQNYRPELPQTNRSHLYEDNGPFLK